jgi:hypothetical protein
MQRYSYSVALRIWHPCIDPAEITAALGIKPEHAFMAGAQRKTPEGTPLEGVYRESYWHADPFNHGERLSSDASAEDAIQELLGALSPHRTFFHTIRKEGARALVQINSYSRRNYAVELPPELLGEFNNLGLGFAHDVYPCSQN